MEYTAAVDEARRLVKRSEEDQWRLAQLTYEQLGNGISQERWAADVGMSRRTVRRFAAVWQHWGMATSANRPSWTEAVEDVDPGLRVGRARHEVRNMPPEEKAAVVREALDDPDVATRVMRDPHTSARMSHAREEVYRERIDTAKIREQDSPRQREAAHAAEHFEVGNHLRMSRFHAAEAARRLQDITDRDEGMVRAFQGDAQEVRDALDWFEVVVRGGKVDDDALAKFLEGGAS